jgi:hypothetical protein
MLLTAGHGRHRRTRTPARPPHGRSVHRLGGLLARSSTPATSSSTADPRTSARPTPSTTHPPRPRRQRRKLRRSRSTSSCSPTMHAARLRFHHSQRPPRLAARRATDVTYVTPHQHVRDRNPGSQSREAVMPARPSHPRHTEAARHCSARLLSQSPPALPAHLRLRHPVAGTQPLPAGSARLQIITTAFPSGANPLRRQSRSSSMKDSIRQRPHQGRRAHSNRSHARPGDAGLRDVGCRPPADCKAVATSAMHSYCRRAELTIDSTGHATIVTLSCTSRTLTMSLASARSTGDATLVWDVKVDLKLRR